MKYQLTLFLFLLLLMQLGCDRSSEKAQNQFDDQGRKHGLWVETYPNGRKSSEVRYKHGAKAGTETTYFENGNPNIVRVWAPDTTGSVLDGPYYHFYRSGKPLLRATYAGGVPQDTITQFYRSGIMEFRGQYDSGMAVGTWKYYDENGNLELTISHEQFQRAFHDELKSGTYIWYDTLGNPVYRGTWFKGQLHDDSVLNRKKYNEWKRQEKIDLSSRAL